jgi:glycine/D-amino acid oxidase-like deaminating enzyme
MHTSKRIVVVGGGIAGLSIAARVAQAGLPVTVLEASHVGVGASTRNQGWLYSGAWFAPDQPDLARMCYESLQQTVRFSPECLEPGCGSMVHLISEARTDPGRWTSAWNATGIPYEALAPAALFERFPGLAISQARHAFELPDRAIRSDLLLRRLAAAAEQAGAEIRPGTAVTRLIQKGDSVQGVRTIHGETIPARLVILAGNVAGGFLFPGFGAEAVGSQAEVALVVVKTHLVAVRPGIAEWPLCVVDAEGFNHIPHPPNSVLGINRFVPVSHGDDEQMIPNEVERLWNSMRRFFPDFRRDDHTVIEWAGNTVQAMHVDQIEAGRAPRPTIVDHERESPTVTNLLSAFPGRSSLWPQLAELARQAVLQKLDPIQTRVATPPWGNPDLPLNASP